MIIDVRENFGAAVLLVEQNAGLALSVAERGYLMQSGKIVASSPISELKDSGLMRDLYLGEGRRRTLQRKRDKLRRRGSDRRLTMAISRDKSMQLGELDRPGNLPSRVASLISTEIAENRLKPGDRLPTEQELAEMLGVSRNVVREAIARLRSDGVLHSRQGAGVLVETASAVDPPDRSEGARGPGGLPQALRASPDSRMRGRRHLPPSGRTEGGDGGDHPQHSSASASRALQIEADSAFHRAVARATDNNYMTTFVNFISEQVAPPASRSPRRSSDPAVNARILSTEHGAIPTTPILARRPSLARAAMRRHISNAASRLGLKP